MGHRCNEKNEKHWAFRAQQVRGLYVRMHVQLSSVCPDVESTAGSHKVEQAVLQGEQSRETIWQY